MTVDPFAAPAPEEAQQPEADRYGQPTGATAGAITVDVKPNILSADLPEQVRITFKGGSGNAPWITTDFPSIAVAHARLTDNATKTQLVEIFDVAAKATAAFEGFFKSTGGGNTGGASSAPQGATEAPSWAPAKHQPDAVYKTGVSKAGKVWHAWMAPEKGGYDPKFFYQN